MKSMIFILILNSLIFCACREERGLSDNEVPNIKDNILASYIDNKDSVFNIVENNILQYAHCNDIVLPVDIIRRYDIIDSLLHIIYNSEISEKEFKSIYNDLVISVNQFRFLNRYLRRELKAVVNSRIYILLDREQSLADSLISAQQSFLKTHIDNAGRDGSLGFIKYYNVEITLLSELNKSLKDLLISITLPENKVQYSNTLLTKDFFDNEFRHITTDLIPQKPLFSSKYSEEADRLSVKFMKDTWNLFLSNRKEIASLLNENQKSSWNNATYRFQRTQLITLKNEFVNLGIYGNEIEKCLLSDSCTDEQLMAYPNFSIKWEEYIKELYR